MSWSLDRTRNVWVASEYDDLQYAEINNLAEFGQPFELDKDGWIADYEPDFSNIVVEMPQIKVMTVGYGATVQPTDFPIVRRFLSPSESAKLPDGTYRFDDFVRTGFANDHARWYDASMYRRFATSLLPYGLKRHTGDIDPADAAYIHGSVSFALKIATSTFVKTAASRKVTVEMCVGNDNFDCESDNLLQVFDATVCAVAGPAHFNMDKPILIHFTGPGKIATAEDSSITRTSLLLTPIPRPR
jgi:hypothetical protein